MSKKSKKQREKTRKAQVRRESGVTLRAVNPPPTAVAKVIELKSRATSPVADAPVTPPPVEVPAPQDEPAAAARHESLAPEVPRRNAVVPAKPDAPENGAEPRSERSASDNGAEPAVARGERVEVAVEAPRAEELSPAPVEEQRASRRVVVEVDIHLSSESHFFSGLSGDISEGGLFLSTYRPLAIGTQVDVEFSLPGSERSIQAKGEVRWIREHSVEQPRGVGIAFEDLSADDRDKIHAFCSARPPLYYEDVG